MKYQNQFMFDPTTKSRGKATAQLATWRQIEPGLSMDISKIDVPMDRIQQAKIMKSSPES